MKDDEHAVLRVILRTCVYVFAIVGVGATCYWVYWAVRLPHVVASPDAFLVLDIYRSSEDRSPIMHIYLDAPSSPSDVQFDGAELTHRLATPLQVQEGPGPLRRVVVNGKGTIRFGSTVIGIDDGAVAVNGHNLCPSEITVTRHGVYREGYIRTAR